METGRDAMKGQTENILNYEVNSSDVSECVRDIVGYITVESKGDRKIPLKWLACLNPHSYVVALNDKIFSRALKQADWLIADGVGIVLASTLLGGNLRERVTGSDIFEGVLKELNRRGYFSLFFLGSTEENLKLIESRIAVDYPNLRVSGTFSPKFKLDYTSSEIDEMVTIINSAKPDVLWVGMTAPKQEKWIYENRHRLELPFAAAIGAVFDFYTGKVRRSHDVFQRWGLEWLPRLVQQPLRLWRRIFVSAPIFLWHVIKFKVQFVFLKSKS